MGQSDGGNVWRGISSSAFLFREVVRGSDPVEALRSLVGRDLLTLCRLQLIYL